MRWDEIRRTGDHLLAAVFTPVRLTLGRFLAFGLEFQLAADVLRTAVDLSSDKAERAAEQTITPYREREETLQTAGGERYESSR
ncbi:hypothetical protein MCAG_00313 [Micromonospora sp. ATCC 39149]|uniref:DUF1622 domain-containing protein n=1 Tax=Micromonospora carbonacea TaxID=47853 RepID=A0A7D5Y4S1_9ACTN|nr:hypothetical protein MCAG_00313 [Micromonospora sp. ATCC 39149]QLJ96432.1 DUF1622 domain-containing protein [Micromonospora carbonacea]